MFASLVASVAAAAGPQWSLAQRDGFLAVVMVFILLIGTTAIVRIMLAAARES